MQVKYRNSVFCRLLFSLKFVGTVFVSEHVIAESSIILTKYISFSQLHLTGFQV